MTIFRKLLVVILGVVPFFLSSCAAIQGARGDAAVAKQTAEAQATVSQQTGKVLNTGTITPPTQPSTPGQNAATNAAKVIAPLH
jgi:hypothetical protein